jgi:hypothetical protein
LFAQLDFVLSPEILEISFIVTGKRKELEEERERELYKYLVRNEQFERIDKSRYTSIGTDNPDFSDREEAIVQLSPANV